MPSVAFENSLWQNRNTTFKIQFLNGMLQCTNFFIKNNLTVATQLWNSSNLRLFLEWKKYKLRNVSFENFTENTNTIIKNLLNYGNLEKTSLNLNMSACTGFSSVLILLIWHQKINQLVSNFKYTSCRSQMFFEIGALKNSALFTGKHSQI